MDLYRLLSEYPLAMLRAIAENWQLSLSAEEPMQAARKLGDAMLAPGALARRVAGLSPEAREALYSMAQSGGSAATKSLSLRFGELRHIGPARLERERAWDEAASPLEELLFSGLAFRTFGTVAGGHGELLIVPPELLARLGPVSEPAAVQIETIESPPQVADQGLGLCEDLLAILCYLRREQPLARPDEDHVQPPDWLLSDETLESRLIGPKDVLRLRLGWRLLWRLNLIEERGGRLRPAITARDWLRAPDVSRAATLFRAWRDDPRTREIHQIASLNCDPGGCPYDPVTARRALIGALAMLCPGGAWHALDAVVQAIKERHPAFLRPDGDLSSWFIRDAKSGQYLRGAASWDHVEAALAIHLFTKQLYWLGAVRLGRSGSHASFDAVGLTQLGLAMLSRERASAQKPLSPLAEIEADGAIRIAAQNSAYERYQLERIATWQEQNEWACYLLNEDSVWEGYNAGITMEQMTAFLRRISGDGIPSGLALLLQAWAGRFGRASFRRATLLVLADKQTADEIYGDRHLQALIAEQLSPTILLVKERDVDQLTALLKQRGIWPQRWRDGV